MISEVYVVGVSGSDKWDADFTVIHRVKIDSKDNTTYILTGEEQNSVERFCRVSPLPCRNAAILMYR